MRKILIVSGLVLPVLAWLLWPLASPRFEIRFDPEKSAAAKAFLAEPRECGATPPNVVVIVADDMGKFDGSVYAKGEVDTPALESLARTGVRFDAGYITSPVCSPSRAALMTGRYQQRFGFEILTHDRYTRNRLEWLAAKYLFSTHGWSAVDEVLVPPAADMLRQGLPPSELTLAELMKTCGYATGIFGKWHLGFGEHAIPEKRGFDYQYGFYDAFATYKDPDDPDVVNARGGYFPDRYQWWKGRHGNCAIRRNGAEIDEDVYLTTKIADEAVAWIEAHKSRPYFAYVPFNAPHAPLQAERKYYDRFAHVPDETHRVYLAMIASLDEAVGRVLAATDDNTLVFFLSDNGGASYTGATDNAPLRGGKLMNFEGGLNVPFLMRWPAKIPAPITYTHAVSSLDVFMTITRAAGVTLPTDRPYDGVDLLPFVRGEVSDSPHAALFWRAEGHRAIRAGKYKLISDRRTGSRALFDLDADPGEVTNLLAQNAALAADLEAQLQAWETQLVSPKWPRAMEFHFSFDGQPYVFPL